MKSTPEICFAIIALMTWVKPSIQQEDYCQEPVLGDQVPLKWTNDLATLAYTCIGQYVRLYCCAEGYESILWYIKRPEEEWQPVITNYEKYFGQENQTLVIQATDTNRDEGQYKCNVTDSKGNYITNSVKLEAVECATWHEAPIIFLPNQKVTTAHVYPGQNFTLTCSAFYGNCNQIRTGCYVDWDKIINGSVEPILEMNVSARVHVTSYTGRFNNQGQENLLTIRNIEESDYGHYVCWAYTSSNRKTKRDVFLKKKYPEPAHPGFNYPLLFGIVGAAVFIPTVIIIVKLRCGLDIKLKYKEKFNRKKEVKMYNVAILHSDEDREDKYFAEEILWKKLQDELKYKVFMPKDVLPGEHELQKFAEIENICSCFIFVISPAFFEDGKCRFILEEMVAQNYRNFMFVMFKEINTSERKSLCEKHHADTIFKAINVGRKFKWPTPDKRNVQNKRNLDNFWKNLRYHLFPPVNEQDQQQTQDDSFDDTDVKQNNGGVTRNVSNRAVTLSNTSRESQRPLLSSSSSQHDNGNVFEQEPNDASLHQVVVHTQQSKESKESGFASGESI